MRTKFRKTVFFIIAFIIICFTLSNRTARSQAGISMSINKEIYYEDDIIKVSYSSVPGDEDENGNDTGVVYRIEVRWSTGGHADSRGFYGKDIQSGVWEVHGIYHSDLEGENARDGTVTLNREDKRTTPPTVTTLVTKHFRFRKPKYKPLPGALQLRGGSRFKLGDPIIADVNLPSSVEIPDPVFTDKEIFGDDIYVGLAYLNRKTRGGAIQPDRGVYLNTYNFHLSRINTHVDEVIVNQSERLLPPGIYELRLYRREGYVVDSVRFEVVLEPWPNSLKVVSPDDFKVGEEIKLQLNPEALPFKDFEDFSSSPFNYRLLVSLFKVVNNIEEIHIEPADHHAKNPYPAAIIDDVYLQYLWRRAEFFDDYDINFTPSSAGKYMLLFTYEPDNPVDEVYVLDHLEIEVSEKKELSHYIGTGKKFRFTPDEKIPVEVYVPKAQAPGMTTTVSLDGQGEHEEWEIEPGKKKAWTVGDLALGSYTLTLETTFIYEGKKVPMGQPLQAWFEVVPAFNTVKINIKNKNNFLYGETVTFDVTFPKSIDPKKVKLVYEIVEKGGFIPGCAMKGDSFAVERTSIEDGLKNISFVTPAPGKYVLQLIGFFLDDQSSEIYHYSNTYSAHVWSSYILAEAPFTVDLQWQPGGLAFPSQKDEFAYEEEIHVAIDAHADLGMSKKVNEENKKGKYMLYLHKQGDVGYGKAYRYPWRPNHYDLTFTEKEVTPTDNFVLKNEKSTSGKQPAWPLPGAYEFRLENGRGFLVSRLPFYITEPPQSPFPLEKGMPGVPQASDLESPGLSKGLRIGEFLTADTCGTLLKPEVESMTLAFVKWDEDQRKYVPIEGALEFGQSFYIEGKLEKEASSNFYAAEIKGPSGRVQEVILWTDEDDKTVVRSERLYSIWEDTGGGG